MHHFLTFININTNHNTKNAPRTASIVSGDDPKCNRPILVNVISIIIITVKKIPAITLI